MIVKIGGRGKAHSRFSSFLLYIVYNIIMNNLVIINKKEAWKEEYLENSSLTNI